MVQKLSGLPQGTFLFVSYLVGRPPTARAIEEARPHTENPTRARRHFVGVLTRVWTARNGDPIMTIHADNRDTIVNGFRIQGGYRSFNPALGELLAVEVLS